MIRRAVAAKVQGRLGGPFLLACLLGLALLLGHQLVMASAQHAAEMGMDRGQVTLTAGTAQVVVGSADDLTPVDQQPLTGWEACFSQEGLLPTLLLLLTLAGIWWRCAGATLGDMLPRVGIHIARFLHPPPLAPTRRRALLQVFLN